MRSACGHIIVGIEDGERLPRSLAPPLRRPWPVDDRRQLASERLVTLTVGVLVHDDGIGPADLLTQHLHARHRVICAPGVKQINEQARKQQPELWVPKRRPVPLKVSIGADHIIEVLTRGLRRYLLPILIAAALIITVAFAAVPGLRDKAFSRATTQRSVHDRQNTDAAALRVIGRHPLTGLGWLRFIDVNQDYVRQARDYPITNINIKVHNVPLSPMAELGIPGGAL
jgi:O-Antigen ligase